MLKVGEIMVRALERGHVFGTADREHRPLEA